MNKLKPVIAYQFTTKLKAVGIFYTIQYAISAFILILIALLAGEKGTVTFEPSTVTFISVIGILGFTEDFKALLQNGYTRKYIYLGTLANFLMLAGLMSLVDTLVSRLLYQAFSKHFTLFGNLYGNPNPIGQWLFFLSLYFLFSSLFYLGVLVVKKLGNLKALFLGVGISGLVLVVSALFQYVLAPETVAKIGEFFLKVMGFVHGFASNRPINLAYPILTMLTLAAVFQLGGYAILRRSELK